MIMKVFCVCGRLSIIGYIVCCLVKCTSQPQPNTKKIKRKQKFSQRFCFAKEKGESLFINYSSLLCGCKARSCPEHVANEEEIQPCCLDIVLHEFF